LASSLVTVRPYAARLLPIIAIGAILALSWFVGNRIAFNPRLVACVGYGASYGYAGGPPTVTSVVPAAGPTSGGTTVTITGKGYCGGTAAPSSVTFGGTAATSFVVNSDTSITAVSPAHAAGTVDVQVTTSNGTSGINAGDQFTYGAFTSYFQWYDKASAGFLNDNIHLFNPSGSVAHVQVNVDGGPTVSATVAAGTETYVNFPQGTIGGPVVVNSDVAVLASQRVQYNASFNEVWAETASQAATTSFIQWYDKASAGFLNDNIHLLNPGALSATVTVSVPGATNQVATVPAQSETYVTFPQGTIGGPITISSTQPVLASQRVQYNQSFNEVWSESASQAAANSFINWYDKASTGFSNDNIHLFNPGGSTSNVSVTFDGGQTTDTVNVTAGSETYVNFPQGSIGGPVHIIVNSGPAVLASQRVQYYSSFNEVWAESAAQAAMTSYVNWYDKASPGMFNDNIHLLNPGGTSATVTVSLSGATPQMVTVAAGAESYVTFPAGSIGGPVTVSSSQPVLASQRVQYYSTFNEVLAESAAQAATTSHFTWYDKASAGMFNDNIHLLNPGGTSATVTVSLSGAPMQTATVAAGAEAYITFPAGSIGGPVTVSSSQPVLASQRVQYYSSFNEIWAG